MIAVAIVCAAAFVNAATVGWSFGLINGYGTDGSGWSDSGLTGDVTVQLIIGTTLTGGVIGDTIYDAESTVAFDGGYAYPDALEISGMANDTPYYSKLIITSGDSTLESGVFQLAAAAMEGGVVYPGYGLGADSYGIDDATSGSLAGLSTFNSVGGVFADAGWVGSAPVPEPTSGLLMLLGMAGLALRRRRA